LVPGKARNCTENIVEELINWHKEKDIPVNWTKLAESVKKAFEDTKIQWPEGTEFCDEISQCVDVVVGERHIAALQKDIKKYALQKHDLVLIQ